MEQPAAWQRHHAALASCFAISSMTWTNVRGSTSPPSRKRGRSRRNSEASKSARCTGSGSRRSCSVRSLRSSRSGASARARSSGPAVSCASVLVDSEVVDLARARPEAGGEDEAVLTGREGRGRRHLVEAARIALDADRDLVLVAHTHLLGAAEGHEGAAADLQVAIVVAVTRLELHERRVRRRVRADEDGLLLLDPELGLPTLQHDLALALEERHVGLEIGRGREHLDVLVADELVDH